MRLQIKIAVTFLLLSLLPLVLTGVIAYPVALNAMKTSLGTSFQQIAHETIDKVDRSVFEVYQNVLTWSKLDIMQEILTGDLDGKISTYLMEVQREYGYFANIVALNEQGKVVAASDPVLIGQDVGGAAFHREAMNGRPYVDDVHVDESTQEWVVTFSFPVKAQFMDGKIVGVLRALWNAEELERLTQAAQSSVDRPLQAAEVFLTREDGLVISAPASHRERIFRDNLIQLGLRSAAKAARHTEGYLIEELPGSAESLLGYGFSNGHRDYPGWGWGILVAQDTSAAFAPIRRLNLIVLFIGTLVALAVSVMSVVVSRRMAKPILGIADVARRVSLGDFSGKAEHTSPDEIGALAGVFNQMIVDLKRQREQLVEKHYVDSIIANMMNSLVVVDPAGVVKTADHATLDLLGYGEGELVGRSAEVILPGALSAQAGVDVLLSGTPVVNRETTYLAKDGGAIPVLFSASVMRNEQGRVQGIVCVAQDLTERKRAEETLAEQAIRDSLTGLYNRRYFDRRIRAELARAERSDQPLAILLCDLDRFKAVNDTCSSGRGREPEAGLQRYSEFRARHRRSCRRSRPLSSRSSSPGWWWRSSTTRKRASLRKGLRRNRS